MKRILRSLRRFFGRIFGRRRRYNCDGCRRTIKGPRAVPVAMKDAVLLFCPSCVAAGKAVEAKERRKLEDMGVLARFYRDQAMNENFRKAYGGKERG